MNQTDNEPKDGKEPQASPQQDSSPAEPATQVRCPAAKDPAVRLFILAAMLIAFGVWCYSDPRPAPIAWTWAHLNEIAGYLVNNFSPFIFIPLGIIAGAWAIKMLKRVLLADSQGIGYEGKQQIAWDQVTTLDATKIQKGFLFINYGDDERLVLDSWKLQNFKDLVRLVERQVPQGKQVK